jgi:hypothetical protein
MRTKPHRETSPTLSEERRLNLRHAQRLRDKLHRGILPGSIPEHSSVRFGTGVPCCACDEPINPDEPALEYEVVPGKGPRLSLHCLCVAVWETVIEEINRDVDEVANDAKRSLAWTNYEMTRPDSQKGAATGLGSQRDDGAPAVTGTRARTRHAVAKSFGLITP